PDKAAFQAAEVRIKSEIDAVQAELTAARDKLSSSYANTPGDAVSDKYTALVGEPDDIRGQHPGYNIQTQIRVLHDSIGKWVDEPHAAKTRGWAVAHVQAHIEHLRRQIKSGSMTVVEEEHARRELSHLAHLGRTATAVQSKQDAIDADRRVLCELRRQLDNPELMALSDRYEAITAELGKLHHEFYVKPIQECNALQARSNDLWKEKREVSQELRDASDRYWAQVQDGRDCKYEEVGAQNTAEE
ncbi:hypothetical protein BKA83DRAFT_4000951, partial [Pisolithus microcarpus]